MIFKIIDRIKKKYYKLYVQSKIGYKPQNLEIKGSVDFEGCFVKLGDNITLYPGISFAGNGKIVVGNNCKIGRNVIIYANKTGGVYIGNNTIIAAQTYIIDSNHTYSDFERHIQEQPLDSEPIRIGDDVWIGGNVMVIKGAEIGRGSVIGAKSLVKEKIEDYSVAVGIPAKVIRLRKK